MSTHRSGVARTGAVGLAFTAFSMVLLFLLGGTASAQTDTATGQDSTANTSDGSSGTATGDADATGNTTTSKPTQSADVRGHNGAVVIVGQDATVSNGGTATANTGGNTATGNGSDNTAGGDQTATGSGNGSGTGVANNTANTSNSSDGSAGIKTGDATATGNSSTTDVNQVADVDTGGGLGGIVIIDQEADVTNSGDATATTGDNDATGNASDNEASSEQDAEADGSIANNSANTSNSSDGSAGIKTGNAGATGNSSTTGVNQIANATVGGSLGGIVIINQSANVSNTGTATADTGGNTATGNQSNNQANTVQGAVSGAGPPADTTIASNDGQASNLSGGNATINTGDATATGNRSNTNVTQAANASVNGPGIVIVNQDSNVTNDGTAVALTGGNDATGNVSDNTAETIQTAQSDGEDAGTSVAANFGSASNKSDGSAYITTGDAKAVGNASTTNVTQSANVDTDGGITLVDQDADVTNSGDATADTGGNTAVGNASVNDAFTDQDAVAGDAGGTSVAGNFGEAKNVSDGTAVIATGDAKAIGNKSTTNIAQVANTAIGGAGFAADDPVIDQEADVDNTGFAEANSGGNTATGNESQNTAVTLQDAVAGDGTNNTVASNFGSASNRSDGSARITTGDAKAIGNKSKTNIAQVADTDIDGAGFVLVDQDADVDNFGVALANSGDNTATGNASENLAFTVQDAEAGDGDGNVVVANFASASNVSDGTAVITTGDAKAIGNKSKTNIGQVADTDIDGAGFVMVDQDADVANFGFAAANSGFNTATGNESFNLAVNVQDADALLDGVDADVEGNLVVSNDGQAINKSDGTAVIATGDAKAIGNKSKTNIGQVADTAIGGAGLAGEAVDPVVDQDADVVNTGEALANSGFNTATGNASFNVATNVQDADLIEDDDPANDDNFVFAEDIVVSNIATTTNKSDGTAAIATGDATAIGNHSTTNVVQVADTDIDGAGFVLVDQDADVENFGFAAANSGFNTATGNASFNVATNVQDAAVIDDDGQGDGNDVNFVFAEDIVVSNLATTANVSDGTAAIATGDATAIGNKSTTNVAQVADTDIDGAGFALVDQDADVVNAGGAFANSGFNTATGNASFNLALNVQDADLIEDDGQGDGNDVNFVFAEDIVVSNLATTANVSDGSATIVTGCACAIGNKSTTNVAQVADTDIDGAGFVLVDQDADVENFGFAAANSGFNTATGNASFNQVSNFQDAAVIDDDDQGDGNDVNFVFAEDIVVSNIATTTNKSDGTAAIATGDATAIGNHSTTNVVQVADTAIGGAGLAGQAVDPVVDQDADVVNFGEAFANSGFNTATGNASFNVATNVQDADLIEDDGPGDGNDDNFVFAEDIVVSNIATTTNKSDGTAAIATGDATAIGNHSTTNVAQVADTDIDGAGFVLVDQDADVENFGFAAANSGFNTATGNASFNQVSNFQDAAVIDDDGPGDGNDVNFVVAEDIVVSNIATTVNKSDGTATIHTGDATAFGNVAVTNVVQVADTDIDGAGFVLVDQDADVVNDGEALANSGGNTATGNASFNVATNVQGADLIEDDDPANDDNFVFAEDIVVSNIATTTNVSDGTAIIDTGDATAVGNLSGTSVSQAAHCSGTFCLVDQDADVDNFGFAVANSGDNTATGNDSVNVATNVQDADLFDDDGFVVAEDVVVSNIATTVNKSDGTADIATGDAVAFGNVAATTVCQGVNADLSCPRAVLPDIPVPPVDCEKEKEKVPEKPKKPEAPKPEAEKKPEADKPEAPEVPEVEILAPVAPVVVSAPAVKPAALAVTGVSVAVQVLFGLLLLALGALLRRRAHTA